MNVADYIADFLYELGVRNIFMLSGTGSVKLDDAFARKKGMKYICSRHEATAVVMAEAVAKLKNNLGVAVVTTGPGGTNAIAGVVEAWVDSTPVMVISGQVSSTQYIKDRAFGIQGFNIIDNVEKFTKYSALLTDPNLIKYHLEKAVYEATSGRPGPVWIDIPMDLQSKEVDLDNMIGFVPPICDINKTHLYDLLIEKIISSERPLIAFGKGVKISKTTEKLIKILEELNVPSISARMANDAIPFSHKNYFGMGGIRGRRCAARVMKKADLLVALGTSCSFAFLGEDNACLNSGCQIAVVNIDEKIFTRKDLEIELGIQADLDNFLSYLLKNINTIKQRTNFKKWLGLCQTIKKEYPMVVDSMKGNPINSYHLIECLSQLTDSRHIFINDAGSSAYISSQALNFKDGQRELTSGAFYTMGLTLPLAIGAAVCEPNSQIIAISGDGSLELNIQELQTININNLNIKVFVINNGGYASIRDSQDAMCGGRYTDSEQILNFQKIANAFGLGYEIIETEDQIENKVKSVLSESSPMLIEVVCDSQQHMIQPLEEMKELENR